jgi:hypothetical protein
MRYIMVSIFLLQHAALYSQRMLERQIDIDVQAMPLEHVLNELQQKYGIFFSYGFDRATGTTPVSIHANSISIYAFIQKLAQQANLEFIIVGTTIVFRRICTSLQETNQQDAVYHPRINLLTDSTCSRRIVIEGVILPVIPAAKFRYIPVMPAIQPEKSRLAQIEVPPTWQLLLIYDSRVNSEKLDRESPYSHGRIAIGVVYQTRSRILAYGIVKRQSDFDMLQNRPRGVKPFTDNQVALGVACSLFQSNKTMVWVSPVFVYTTRAGLDIGSYRSSGQKVYLDFVFPSAANSSYSGNLCCWMDHRLSGKNHLMLSWQYDVYRQSKSEVAPPANHMFFLNIGFRYLPRWNSSCDNR